MRAALYSPASAAVCFQTLGWREPVYQLQLLQLGHVLLNVESNLEAMLLLAGGGRQAIRVSVIQLS